MTLTNPKQLILAALIAIALPSVAEPVKRPNIILIMADDLGYSSLGCYGSTEIRAVGHQ